MLKHTQTHDVAETVWCSAAHIATVDQNDSQLFTGYGGFSEPCVRRVHVCVFAFTCRANVITGNFGAVRYVCTACWDIHEANNFWKDVFWPFRAFMDCAELHVGIIYAFNTILNQVHQTVVWIVENVDKNAINSHGKNIVWLVLALMPCL